MVARIFIRLLEQYLELSEVWFYARTEPVFLCLLKDNNALSLKSEMAGRGMTT